MQITQPDQEQREAHAENREERLGAALSGLSVRVCSTFSRPVISLRKPARIVTGKARPGFLYLGLKSWSWETLGTHNSQGWAMYVTLDERAERRGREENQGEERAKMRREERRGKGRGRERTGRGEERSKKKKKRTRRKLPD